MTKVTVTSDAAVFLGTYDNDALLKGYLICNEGVSGTGQAYASLVGEILFGALPPFSRPS